MDCGECDCEGVRVDCGECDCEGVVCKSVRYQRVLT